MTRQTIPEIFGNRVKEYGTKLLYQRRDGWSWKQITWLDFERDVKNVASYLMDLGIQPGDKVIVISANTLDAITSEMALYHLGAVVVPLSTDASFEKISETAISSRARAVFLEHQNFTEDFIEKLPELPDILSVIYFPAVRIKHDRIANFQTVRKAGLMKKKKLQDELDEISKGLSHQTAAAAFQTQKCEFKEVSQGDITNALREIEHKYHAVGTEDQTFSYIPTSSPFSKIIGYFSIYKSTMACTAESRDDFYKDILEVMPTVLMDTSEGMNNIYKKLSPGVDERPSGKQLMSGLGGRVKYIFSDYIPDENIKDAFTDAGISFYPVPELNALID